MSGRLSAPGSAACCSPPAMLHGMGYVGLAFVSAAGVLLAATWVREAPLARVSGAP